MANLEAVARDGATFEGLANELLAKKQREGKATATMIKNKWMLEAPIAAFGNRNIADISAPEILSPGGRPRAER